MKKNLLYILSAIAIIATCTYLGYEAIRIRQLADNGAVMSLTTQKFERTIISNNKILVLGDSLAYGVGASNPELSFAGKLAKKYDNSSIINKAEIGETIGSLKNTIDNKITDKYDKIFMIVGGNDIMRIHINILSSANNLDYVIGKASQHTDKVILITTGNFKDVSLSPWILKGVFNYRANIVREAAINLESNYSNYSYIDFYSVPINSDEYKGYEAKDGYHLNDSGIEKLLSTTLETM